MVNLHPFLDGNKRTAFEVTKNFLRLNGCRALRGRAGREYRKTASTGFMQF
jgi:prophage maintenance system killer protein